MSADARMAAALRGRSFSGQAAPARPESNVVPLALPKLRDGDIHLGDTAANIPVGIDLGKLIEGRLLIQGNSGAGKSMLLRRLFEQAFGRVQQLLIDPDGEFSTLADSFDVAVLNSAEMLRVGGGAFAHHLREHQYSAVLDLSDATSEQRLSIVADIAAGLVNAPEAHWRPLLVLIDEAQTFAPHYDTGDVDAETRKRAIASLADLMGRGRKRGVAGIIATQRLAETSKAVCSKATNIIVGRTIFDRDLERAGALLGFTVGQSRPIRTLPDGEFLCLGPALAGPKRMRFKAGPVVTRHKGAAPKVAPPPKMSAAQSVALLKQVPGQSAEGSPSAGAQRNERGVRRGRDWRPEEDEIIRAGYAVGQPIAAIGAQLAAIGYGTSTSNISMRAHSLGLISARAAVAWSDREDEIVRDAYVREVRIIDIVDLLAAEGFARGRVAIQMRAIGLGITRDRVNYWTEPEKAIATAGLEAGKPHREILEELRQAGFHRGVTALFKFAQKNNFSRGAEAWTLDELDKLKNLYAKKLPVKEIAEQIGKSISAVRGKASVLGLKMREAWTEEDYKRLRRYSEDGTSLIAAAQNLGRSYINVSRVASTLRLDFSQNRKTKAASKPVERAKPKASKRKAGKKR
jgi:GTPase SAR1 family protein